MSGRAAQGVYQMGQKLSERDQNKDQANRAYELMFQAAREKLAVRDPADVAEKTGAVWHPAERALTLDTLGQNVRISVPDYRSEPVLENWQYLVVLHYLISGDGTRPTGNVIAVKDMKNGMIRGTKFEFTARSSFARILKGKEPDRIREACAGLGGREYSGKGDICEELPFLPNFPVRLSIWLADDEFETSAQLFLDETADHYLTIEDGVTAGEIVIRRLEEQLL